MLPILGPSRNAALRPLPVLVSLVLCWLALPVSAFEPPRIATEPSVPVASEPFRLIVSAELLSFRHSRALEDRSVVIEEGIIRIVQKGTPIPISFSEIYIVSVEVGPLEQGTWTVELEFVDQSTGQAIAAAAPQQTKNIGQLWVSRPIAIEGPSVIYGSDPLSYEISGVDSCVGLGEVTSQFDADSRTGRIRIPWNFGCVILPPEPTLQTFDTGEIGPLEAGDWTVEVVTSQGDPMAHQALTILPDPATLRDGRFRLEVDWQSAVDSGRGRPVGPPTEDSVLYWFFEPENWELMAKVLDGCAINGHYWVFTAANTDVAYSLRVVDQTTAAEKVYGNDLGTPAPATTDIEAFPCDP